MLDSYYFSTTQMVDNSKNMPLMGADVLFLFSTSFQRVFLHWCSLLCFPVKIGARDVEK